MCHVGIKKQQSQWRSHIDLFLMSSLCQDHSSISHWEPRFLHQQTVSLNSLSSASASQLQTALTSRTSLPPSPCSLQTSFEVALKTPSSPESSPLATSCLPIPSFYSASIFMSWVLKPLLCLTVIHYIFYLSLCAHACRHTHVHHDTHVADNLEELVPPAVCTPRDQTQNIGLGCRGFYWISHLTSFDIFFQMILI